ncbi:hypothetical protein ERJ75_001698100 [Trypanosoma vivax]|nr:hypothetical protein ERJ75_001698100 [Trypanosoma vivax]
MGGSREGREREARRHAHNSRGRHTGSARKGLYSAFRTVQRRPQHINQREAVHRQNHRKRGKRHHERHNGRRRIHIRRLGCTRSPENINASARRLLNDATLQALDENGTPLRSGSTLSAQLAVPTFTLSTGVTVGDDSKGCPLTVMRGKNNKKPAGVIELTTNKARQVDWAGIWRMTPAGDSTNSASGSGGNAATSFSTIDGAQDRLNTLADRMARMREARKALTKLCTESTKSMPPTAGQARNICTKPTTQDTETLKQAYATQPRPTETSTGETRLGEAKHANKGQRRRQAQLAHTAPTAQSGTKPASSAAQTKRPATAQGTQHAQDSCVSLFGSASSTMHLR